MVPQSLVRISGNVILSIVQTVTCYSFACCHDIPRPIVGARLGSCCGINTRSLLSIEILQAREKRIGMSEDNLKLMLPMKHNILLSICLSTVCTSSSDSTPSCDIESRRDLDNSSGKCPHVVAAGSHMLSTELHLTFSSARWSRKCST